MAVAFTTTDMFLKLGDIKGESMDSVHAGEIDIYSFQWGMSQTGSMHIGTGGGAGKVNIQNISIRKKTDRATPNLMMACSMGTHYPKAILTVRKAGGASPVDYVTITMEEVMVASLSTGSGSGDGDESEDIVLNFGKIHFTYQPQDNKGAKDGGPIRYGWNIRNNVQI